MWNLLFFNCLLWIFEVFSLLPCGLCVFNKTSLPLNTPLPAHGGRANPRHRHITHQTSLIKSHHESLWFFIITSPWDPVVLGHPSSSFMTLILPGLRERPNRGAPGVKKSAWSGILMRAQQLNPCQDRWRQILLYGYLPTRLKEHQGRYSLMSIWQSNHYHHLAFILY